MEIINTVNDIKSLLSSDSFIGKNVGFVPTMGALHRGHLSLIERSVSENDITIASIFVNPRQFNDESDFRNYPVTMDSDIEMLESAGCDILFLPSNEDIYKGYEGFKMDFKGLDEVLEGEFRPGHFQGVVDIVYRLFTIINPNNAYFGEKDFQQLAIISLMVKQAGLAINVVSCPIVREESGLAMSSRNERLSSEERKRASKIYSTLKRYTNNISLSDIPSEIINKMRCEIDDDFLKTEYIAFCEFDSLRPVERFEKNTKVVLCIAVWCKKVRLIDNIILQF